LKNYYVVRKSMCVLDFKNKNNKIEFFKGKKICLIKVISLWFNTLFLTWNKFLNSGLIKSEVREARNSWKICFGVTLLLNNFPYKKWYIAWKNDNLLAIGRKTMVDDAEFQLSTRSIFQGFHVRHVVWRCHAKIWRFSN